jgi:flagellar assembly protein FliH
MSNAAPRKFIFDTEFASDGTVVRAGDTFRQSYSRAEMETMTAAAFEKGKNDETARANAMMAEATRRIADSLQKLVGGLRDEALALRTEAADMALACARKVADAAIAQYPEEEIVAAIEDAMNVLRDSPRLMVGVSADLQAQMQERIGQLADSFGYGAAIVVRADNGVRPGDARIVWGDGSITIDRDEALNRLEAALRRKLTDADEHQADLFANEGHA